MADFSVCHIHEVGQQNNISLLLGQSFKSFTQLVIFNPYFNRLSDDFP